jgi:hypothetical protein
MAFPERGNIWVVRPGERCAWGQGRSAGFRSSPVPGQGPAGTPDLAGAAGSAKEGWGNQNHLTGSQTAIRLLPMNTRADQQLFGLELSGPAS